MRVNLQFQPASAIYVDRLLRTVNLKTSNFSGNVEDVFYVVCTQCKNNDRLYAIRSLARRKVSLYVDKFLSATLAKL